MKFVKMQGCGNDYVYLDAVREPAVAAMMERADWAGRVVRMSDRHKGIGSDGVIVVCPPTAAGKSGGASVRMRMFNADGSESEMCGNGVRCVAKFAHDRLGVNARPMKVETGRGVLGIAYEVSDGKLVSATVDMGEAILDLEQIPIAIEHIRFPDPEWKNARQGEFDIRLPSNSSVRLIAVSMGNPHVVWFRARDLVGSERLERDVLARMGSEIETFKAFPRRTNFHAAVAMNSETVLIDTWERGAGITQACGTGACAVVVAGVISGRLARSCTARVLGGELQIRWDEKTGHVFMTGEAVDVYEGVWPES